MTPKPINLKLEEVKGLEGLLKSKRQLIKAYEKLIERLERRIKELEIENALLKNGSHGKTKKKQMKPRHRQRLGYLKLIAVNGVPIPNKD